MRKPTKRKALEAWQRADAERLRAIWEDKKPMSQELFAEEHLKATQGLFYQYVSGTIPLNLESALKFARGLKVKLSDISPTLAESLRRYVAAEAALTVELSDQEQERLRVMINAHFEHLPKLAKLPAQQQALVSEFVNELLHAEHVTNGGLRSTRQELKKILRTRR